MKEKVENVLKEKVDPVLAEHYGGSVLTAYEDGVAYVKLTGACAQCPSAQSTIEDVVKEILMEELPEVRDVKLDTRVSQDLIDFAKSLMKN